MIFLVYYIDGGHKTRAFSLHSVWGTGPKAMREADRLEREQPCHHSEEGWEVWEVVGELPVDFSRELNCEHIYTGGENDA